MSLSNWRDNGWLVDHQASAEETRDLFAVARRDLRDSGVAGLSSDTQLGLAYNAALQVSTAALAAAGYRAARDRKHHWTIQSLAHTIGADAKLIGRLDAFRKKRNVGDYERAGSTSDQEAAEMRELTTFSRKSVPLHGAVLWDQCLATERAKGRRRPQACVANALTSSANQFGRRPLT
jgi:hypothetical protein